MRRILKYCIVVALSLCSRFVLAECLTEQKVDAALPKFHNGNVYVKSCASQNEEGGDIYLRIVVGGGEGKKLHLKYDIGSYVPTVDTNIFFDHSRLQGIGIGTGSGRDGDGTRYLMIKSADDIVDLGETPHLKYDPIAEGSYSALTGSSDAPYQSVRYYYEVIDDKLTPIKAIGFRPNQENNVVFMDVDKEGKFLIRLEKHFPENKYNLCQNDGVSCLN